MNIFYYPTCGCCDFVPVAQWIRALGCGPRGRGFESLRGRQSDKLLGFVVGIKKRPTVVQTVGRFLIDKLSIFIFPAADATPPHPDRAHRRQRYPMRCQSSDQPGLAPDPLPTLDPPMPLRHPHR